LAQASTKVSKGNQKPRKQTKQTKVIKTTDFIKSNQEQGKQVKKQHRQTGNAATMAFVVWISVKDGTGGKVGYNPRRGSNSGLLRDRRMSDHHLHHP